MNLDYYAANSLNTIIYETHNPYDAQHYKDIFDHILGPDGYVSSTRSSKYISHAGEEDVRIRWKFAARVTKENETRIRNLVSRSKYVPNWTIDMEEN